MTYWNDPREDNYSFDQSFQWNAAMSNLNGMPVRTYKEPSSIIKLTEGGDTPEPDALNFYMPDGGTISLNKTGSPTVVELEYSLDRGQTWTVWTEDQDGYRSLTLTAGQRMYVRNTSETSTGFSTTATDYYQFAFTSTCYANGNLNSLMCKNADEAVCTPWCYRLLFYRCESLLSAPDTPFETISEGSYSYCYTRAGITESPILPTRTLGGNNTNFKYYNMFSHCVNLTKITIYLISYTGNAIENWVNDVSSTGDFYCPAELTISTGVNGIPSGWTRHDI